MGVIDTIANSSLKKIINKIANKIIAKQPALPQDFDVLINRLSRIAYNLSKKEDYGSIKAFCSGIASAFTRIDEIAATFEKETKVFISNIKVMVSFIVDLRNNEEDIKAEYGGVDDVKGNLIESLNALSASIKTKEIPKIKITAKAAV